MKKTLSADASKLEICNNLPVNQNDLSCNKGNIELLNKSSVSELGIKNIEIRSNKSHSMTTNVSMKNEEMIETVNEDINNSTKNVNLTYEKVESSMSLALKQKPPIACSTPKIKQTEIGDENNTEEAINDISMKSSLKEDVIKSIIVRHCLDDSISKLEKNKMWSESNDNGSQMVSNKPHNTTFVISHESDDENIGVKSISNERHDLGESLLKTPIQLDDSIICATSSVSEDLDSRSSSGLSDLSQSQRSKQKYNNKTKERRSKTFVLNILSDVEDKNEDNNDNETKTKTKEEATHEVNESVIVISDDGDSVDEDIQNKYEDVLKTLSFQNENTNSQKESITSQDKIEEFSEKTDDRDSVENVVLPAESAESHDSKSIATATSVECQVVANSTITISGDKKKTKNSLVDPNKIDVCKILPACEQILSKENEKKRIRRESDNRTKNKKLKKPENVKLKRLSEAMLQELDEVTELPSSNNMMRKIREKKKSSSKLRKTKARDCSFSKNLFQAKNKSSRKKGKKIKQIKQDVPANMLNEISNTTNQKNKKDLRSTPTADVCGTTTNFKVSPVKNKRKPLPCECGFQVKKINSNTIEKTSLVGCTKIFKIEDVAVREDLNNKENVLFKGQIKRQRKGLIYSYRNEQPAMGSRK